MKNIKNKDILKFGSFLFLALGFLAMGHHFNLQGKFTYNLIGSSLGEPINKMKVVIIILLVIFIAAMMIFMK